MNKMNYAKLQELSYKNLKKMAIEMELPLYRSKTKLFEEIVKAFKEYEEYKVEKIDKYKRHQQLGEKGKEGLTFLVSTNNGMEYAMKTFRKNKSSKNLKKESELQKLASAIGIAPKVIEIDTVSKYIVMEKMDNQLINVIKKQKGVLRQKQQKQILSIFRKLDKVGVFHGDPNLMNFMYKDNQLYIIDFGMSRYIDKSLIKKLGTKTPNIDIMTLGLVLKLRDMGFSVESYKILIKYISKEQYLQFGF